MSGDGGWLGGFDALWRAGGARRDLWLVLRGDLTYHLRDPVTLLLMVVLPVLLYPLLFGGMTALERSQSAELSRSELAIAAPAEFAGDLVPDDRLVIVDATLDPEGGREQTVLAEVSLPEGVEPAKIRYLSTVPKSEAAMRRARAALERRRDADHAAAYRAAGAPVGPDELVAVLSVDAASAADRAGGALGRWLPLMLVFVVMTGGAYTALDLFAGERERGTLETLLSSRVDRRAVVAATFLVVLLFTGSTGALAIASLGLSAAFGLMEQAVGVSAVSTGSLLLAGLLLVPLTVQLAAVLVVAAAYAPDFKTGQTLAFPLLVLMSAPAAVAALPSVSLSPGLALVPVTNASLALRELLAGSADLGSVALAAAATALHAGVALAIGVRLLAREDVVLGPSATRRRAAGRFGAEAAGLYAVVLALFWFLGQMAQGSLGLWGVALTQVALIAGPAVGAVVLLGLALGATLQIRWPRGGDVALALGAGLAAPGLSMGAGWLSSFVFPASSAWLEAFRAGVTGDWPLGVTLLVFAVLPGICEETLFRGSLLGLLQRNMGPAARVVVVGLLFGFLHLSLARLLPTATLGVLLGVAALRSRSLLVPVLIHVVHNAALLSMETVGWGEDPLSTTSGQVGAGAAAVCAVALVGLLGRGRLDGSLASGG